MAGSRSQWQTNFNPTIVRLKLCNKYGTGFIKNYFNPTIVRLKLASHLGCFVDRLTFQSYNSSIKTDKVADENCNLFCISILQ